MSKYLISVYRPNNFDHQVMLDQDARHDIDALNEEMEVAGVRVFVGGLRPQSTVKSLRWQADGDVLMDDAPTVATEEYVDGFWILECAKDEDALAWGRKAALACRASIEVRPFY